MCFWELEGNWEKGKMTLRVDTVTGLLRCVAGRNDSKDKLKVMGIVVLGQKDHEFQVSPDDSMR